MRRETNTGPDIPGTLERGFTASQRLDDRRDGAPALRAPSVNRHSIRGANRTNARAQSRVKLARSAYGTLAAVPVSEQTQCESLQTAVGGSHSATRSLLRARGRWGSGVRRHAWNVRARSRVSRVVRAVLHAHCARTGAYASQGEAARAGLGRNGAQGRPTARQARWAQSIHAGAAKARDPPAHPPRKVTIGPGWPLLARAAICPQAASVVPARKRGRGHLTIGASLPTTRREVWAYARKKPTDCG